MIDISDQNSIIGEWERFVSAVKENPTIKPVTLEAWKRCREIGLEPDKVKFAFLSDKELEQRLRDYSQVIEIAKPYMDSLSISLTGIPHMVALSDSEGWIIDYRGTPEELGGRATGLCLGASWSEKSIGNNGVGTALATGQPVLVYGVEHYSLIYGACACIGVPIRSNAGIVGALDISVLEQYAHPSRLHIAVACVSSIESAISQFNEVCRKISPDTKLESTNQLIATAVHDIKNPLAIIRGLGELGKLTSDNEKVRFYFDRVIKQVDELNNMVAELINIFNPVELTPKDVVPILEEVVHSFEPVCSSKNIELLLINNANQRVNIRVNICESLFRRAIENLINNVVQIMESGGIIEVKTESDKDFILISIRDNAGGIPEALRDNLFEAYTFQRSGGTGLGLFMAYHTITNTHRGQIWYETQTDQGTTFFIKLPVADNYSLQQSDL